jgi:hypothetical protein
MAPDHLSPISVSGTHANKLRVSAGRIIGQYPLLLPMLYCFYHWRRRDKRFDNMTRHIFFRPAVVTLGVADAGCWVQVGTQGSDAYQVVSHKLQAVNKLQTSHTAASNILR